MTDKINPPPPEFTALSRTMNGKEAAKHWNVTSYTITKWATECGTREVMKHNGRATSSAHGKRGVAIVRALARIDRTMGIGDARDASAMRHLQRVKRWVCFSTRIYGDKEIMYHVGNQKLTLDELLELAGKHGFQE